VRVKSSIITRSGILGPNCQEQSPREDRLTGQATAVKVVDPIPHSSAKRSAREIAVRRIVPCPVNPRSLLKASMIIAS